MWSTLYEMGPVKRSFLLTLLLFVGTGRKMGLVCAFVLPVVFTIVEFTQRNGQDTEIAAVVRNLQLCEDQPRRDCCVVRRERLQFRKGWLESEKEFKEYKVTLCVLFSP